MQHIHFFPMLGQKMQQAATTNTMLRYKTGKQYELLSAGDDQAVPER